MRTFLKIAFCCTLGFLILCTGGCGQLVADLMYSGAPRMFGTWEGRVHKVRMKSYGEEVEFEAIELQIDKGPGMSWDIVSWAETAKTFRARPILVLDNDGHRLFVAPELKDGMFISVSGNITVAAVKEPPSAEGGFGYTLHRRPMLYPSQDELILAVRSKPRVLKHRVDWENSGRKKGRE